MTTRRRTGTLLGAAALLGLLLYTYRVLHPASSERPTESAPPVLETTIPNDGSSALPVDLAQNHEALQRRLEELRATEEDLRAELEALRIAGETREHFVTRCAAIHGADCSRVDPPQDVLDARARCGQVAWDQAAMPEFDPSVREQYAITDHELDVLQQAVERTQRQLEQALEENWRRATGEEPPPDDFPSRAMALSIAMGERFPDEGVTPQLAKELAGHERRPSAFEDRSPTYWDMRIRAESGDRLEEALAEELGAKRARELRRINGGWNRGVHYSAGLCD